MAADGLDELAFSRKRLRLVLKKAVQAIMDRQVCSKEASDHVQLVGQAGRIACFSLVIEHSQTHALANVERPAIWPVENINIVWFACPDCRPDASDFGQKLRLSLAGLSNVYARPIIH